MARSTTLDDARQRLGEPARVIAPEDDAAERVFLRLRFEVRVKANAAPNVGGAHFQYSRRRLTNPSA